MHITFQQQYASGSESSGLFATDLLVCNRAVRLQQRVQQRVQQYLLCAQKQRVATGTLAADEERKDVVKAGTAAIQKRRWPGQRLVGPIVGWAPCTAP